jgi:putative spermidine/putrescine transport system substrate-binding protein
MKRALKLITLAAACVAIAGPAAAQDELVVSSFGGEWTDTHRQLVIDGFEKETGAKVRIVTGYSADIMAQLQAQKSNPQMDVVHFSGGQEALAAAEGLLAPIESEELSNLADMYPIAVEGLARGEGPAFAVAAIGLLYNHDELAEAPTSFLDLAQDEFEDKVLLVDISNSYGLLGLLMMNETASVVRCC